LMVSDNR